jgi:hypothetical protein
MAFGQYFHRIIPALFVTGLVCVHAGDPSAFARAPKEKPATLDTTSAQASGTSPDSSKKRPAKPGKPESKIQAAKEFESGKKTTRRPLQAQRQRSKKPVHQAVAEPHPDLSYMGMFEAPQRYDHGRDPRTGGPPNPHAGDVTHDHFQELDHNRDGVIDPFERASGRLDIDRDLANRQWH